MLCNPGIFIYYCGYWHGLLCVEMDAKASAEMRIIMAKKNDEKKNIALITGASSGFGKEFVKLLVKDKKIDEIWAVARNQERLDKLAEQFGPKIHTYSMDLSEREELKVLGRVIANADVNIRYLFNNAGYGKFGSYEDLDLEESLNMIDLNVSAVVGLGLICIPYMKKGSHIINIASQAAFQPLPYLNIYSATKAFVRNYSRALNQELKKKGISVTAVCPGWMKTGFFERADIGSKNAITQFDGIEEPAKLAKKALRDAKRGKDMSVCGMYSKLGHLAAGILPQKFIMKFWLWKQKMR